MSRRQLSRYQREKRMQRTTLIIGAVVLALVLGIVGYGYYDVFVVPWREPVIRVNDTVFTMSDYVRELRLVRDSSAAFGEEADMAVAPFTLLQTMEDEELIRQGTPRMNVSTSPEEVTAAIRKQFEPPEDAQKTMDSGQIDAEFKQRYAQALRIMRISEDEFRQKVTVEVLRGKLRELLSAKVPTVGPQVHMYGIAFSDAAKAQDVLTRLKNGEDFGVLAKENSTDIASKDKGGDMGWLPKGVLDETLDDMVWALEPNALSDLVFADQTYYIVKVAEKAEAMEIAADSRERLKDRAVESWVNDEREANKIERYFNSEKYAWALQQIQDDKPPQAQQPPQPQSPS